MNKFKKRSRIRGFDYKGFNRYFITICTHDRIWFFDNDILVKKLTESLKNKSDNFGFKVWVFCFMPDHLHLLLEGKLPDSDLRKFISSFKQYTGYHYKKYVAQGFSPAKKAEPRLWQPSYYDHVLRKNEDLKVVARYVLDNPVRKKLVNHFLEYPFLGSFELDIKSL